MPQDTRVISIREGRGMTALSGFKAENYKALNRIGIHLNPHKLEQMRREYNEMVSTMDAIQPTVTTATIPTLLQFLQVFLPGFVEVLTGVRNIDEFVGVMTAGSWGDEQIVQGIKERVSKARPYGDYTNVPLASWNANFNVRNIVRFEQGARMGILEDERSSRIRINNAAEKREACSLSLEIARNQVGFNGYNAGTNNTYGFLNDPGLPGYITVPNGASGFPAWSTKTFLEITADIRLFIKSVRTSSQGNVDPKKTPMTLALPISVVDYLSITNTLGTESVQEWLDKTYPKVRVVFAPELVNANGGVNVAYMYADKIPDSSSDGGLTFVQVVPTRFMVLGVAKYAKGYEEDYSNATAGVMCKRPYAVYRASGV